MNNIYIIIAELLQGNVVLGNNGINYRYVEGKVEVFVNSAFRVATAPELAAMFTGGV